MVGEGLGALPLARHPIPLVLAADVRTSAVTVDILGTVGRAGQGTRPLRLIQVSVKKDNQNEIAMGDRPVTGRLVYQASLRHPVAIFRHGQCISSASSTRRLEEML